MVASGVTVRLRGSHAEDRGSIPGRLAFLLILLMWHIFKPPAANELNGFSVGH